MEVDLSRPPTPLGPRRSFWVVLAVLYGVGFVVWIATLDLLSEPDPIWAVTLLLVLGLCAVGAMSYARWRLVPTAGGLSAAGTLYGPGPDDPASDRRVSDPEERRARQQLRRGRISRREYERIIAYRRFAHGEITRLEYHELLRDLGYDPRTEGGEAPQSASAGAADRSATPGPP